MRVHPKPTRSDRKWEKKTLPVLVVPRKILLARPAAPVSTPASDVVRAKGRGGRFGGG